MRLAGVASAAVLAGCLAVMAVGLLGGPGGSFLPWRALNGASPAAGSTNAAHGPVGAAAGRVPGPTAVPQPSAGPSASSRTATPAAKGATTAATTPTPAITNRGGKTPQGKSRTPPPHGGATRAP